MQTGCGVGKMVKDLDCLDDEESIYPLGYTATRKFPSLAGYLSFNRLKFILLP